MKYFAIINPIAGTRSKADIASLIIRMLSREDCSVDIHTTTGPGDATRIARRAAAENFDVVIACGGDGTVNEVASGLIGTSTALAILPIGSGNGLARHLRIPLDPLAALKVISAGKTLLCDYCTVNNRPFFCTFGVGFDAEVSHDFARKPRRGLTNYVRSCIAVIKKFKPLEYKISVNSQTLADKAFLVVCCNASQYGNNAFIAPGADIQDGKMDLIIIHETNLYQDLILGAELATGLLYADPNIKAILTTEVRIESPSEIDVVAHLDGEPINLHYPLTILVHQAKLNIIAPAKPPKFIPLITPFYLHTLNIFHNLKSLFK